MEFDSYALVLRRHGPKPPEFSEEERSAAERTFVA
jgi:hypothetical protein